MDAPSKPKKGAVEKAKQRLFSKAGAAARPGTLASAPKAGKVTKPTKTPSELAAEKARDRIQGERLKAKARKSHKERISEYNEYLSKLSEHHDIPKVGPG